MSPRVEHIGDATLYLGDCRDVLPIVGNCNLLVTDPPFAVSTPGVGRWEQRYGRTRGDLDFFEGDADWTAMTATVCEAIGCALERLSAPTGSLYVWCGHRQFGPLVSMLEDRGWSTRFLVWAKKHPVPAAPGSGWPSGAELCVYAYRAGRHWSHRTCPHPSNVFTLDSFRFGQPGKVDHPTQKPVALVDPLIEASSQVGDTILDPFMGSGTTGVACANLDRKFIGIEIAAGYFDIACRRIEQAYKQPRLFAEPAPKIVQPSMLDAIGGPDGR